MQNSSNKEDIQHNSLSNFKELGSVNDREETLDVETVAGWKALAS